MSEYTPTTEQVRDFWASDGKPVAKSYDYDESAAEFDRCLADFEAKAKAEALREFAQEFREVTIEAEPDESASADYWKGAEDASDYIIARLEACAAAIRAQLDGGTE